MVYCVWVFRFKRNDPDALWPFLVLVIFSGLFFYSSFSAINSELATSFMSATRRTLMLFCWVFMAASIYRQKLPALLFFGAGNLVFSQLPAMVGYLIGIFHPMLDSYETSLVNIAITAAMALVLVVAIIVVVMRARVSQVVSPGQASSIDPTERAIAVIAEQYALSPRESEIALLVVKGYTLPMIGEKLFISTDTVRSHSKGLYKKLGIHKKQELIALGRAARIGVRQSGHGASRGTERSVLTGSKRGRGLRGPLVQKHKTAVVKLSVPSLLPSHLFSF